MTIDVSDSIFILNGIKKENNYFPDYIKNYLAKYKDFCRYLNVSDKIINSIDNFSKNVFICLVEYGNGQHSSAKYFFDQAIKFVDFDFLCNSLKDNIFYRARINKEGKLPKNEMFHIPFEKRYLVSTQRYSYPGLPCLYLSSSFELCCNELNNWSPELNIATLQKKSDKQITVLDLFFFEKYDFDNLSTYEYEKFILNWPLVACCSMSYCEVQNMNFRYDYVFPQLLLEYVIDKNAESCINGQCVEILGIRYHSVKNNLFINENNNHTSCSNYVFPTLSNLKNGHCRILKKLFIVNEVFYLRELQLEQQTQ